MLCYNVMMDDTMQRRALLGTALVLPALCRTGAADALPVVATFSILGDLLRQVAGERPLALSVLVGPDGDAHGFQPRPSDAAQLRGAALLLRNGLGYDDWLMRLAGAAGSGGTQVTASDGVAPRRAAGVPDPHAWGDPRNVRTYLRNIAAGLAAADPGNAALYARQAATASERLTALDAETRAAFATVPEARRKVLTSHDAFGYFGAAYGIRFLAPQGISTQAEPSAAMVGALIRQVRAERITAVFLENMAGPATLERLAREAGVRVGGRLYSDSLSPTGGPAPSYEALIRHNTGLLVPAMRGD